MTHEEIKFLINALRHSTIKWSGRRDCLRRARKTFLVGRTKKGKLKKKLKWQCADCKRWYRNQFEMEVDHIKEIGSFDYTAIGTNRLAQAIGEFTLKVFARQDNLQALCIVCHKKKTVNFNSAVTQWQRKKNLR